ncbi:MAG: PEP-CTERM/exosortase system-associated acyltransferase [Gammaproteobacteria bacterium]|nr:PEP-CTERM/exosortase system-associated acyltransferase [Gammaproteobacteria bacterium]MCB1923459.1 PEP-CTERM/exosortase system-associated acyltransferase [Gammaproteobacteria bacterium]
MDLVEPYREFFTITLADTDELRKEVFRLRYDVYCRELGWEAAENFPDQLERDIYDDSSRHCLLKHNRSGLFAGTVRMVMTRDSDHEPTIPLIEHCGDNLYDGPFHPSQMPGGSYGEISRLALRSEFRRRNGEQSSPDGHGEHLFEWSQDERRRFPHIALGLYLGASAVGLAEGADGVYAMMEPRLARHLRFAGIRFEQVGDPIEFRGLRAPFYISRKILLRYLSRPLRRLLFAIAEDMQLDV